MEISLLAPEIDQKPQSEIGLQIHISDQVKIRPIISNHHVLREDISFLAESNIATKEINSSIPFGDTFIHST